MRANLAFTLLQMIAVFLPLSADPGALTGAQPTEVIMQPGSYTSSDGKCAISIVTSEKGGFVQLILPSQGKRKRIVNDVTGVGFLTVHRLVYTVSPAYGKPGVYLYDCVSRHAKRIVSPRTKDKAYPNGADYYELQGWHNTWILFYYAPDIDSIDFSNFRTIDFLYKVHSDGSGFQRAQ